MYTPLKQTILFDNTTKLRKEIDEFKIEFDKFSVAQNEFNLAQEKKSNVIFKHLSSYPYSEYIIYCSPDLRLDNV
jgi:hypothetical protein